LAAISSIRNLGPATEEHFAKAGITTAEELHALGAHEAYRRWLSAGLPPHFIGYYVLHMALQGRPWNDCKGEEKKSLRLRFDDLVMQTQSEGNVALEAALNFLGVVRA
jgi:DNA transformation protein and related proteins